MKVRAEQRVANTVHRNAAEALRVWRLTLHTKQQLAVVVEHRNGASSSDPNAAAITTR